MKRYILVILMLIITITSFSQSNQGSNPSVVDLAASPIRQGETGYLNASFSNSGIDPMPIGTYTATFSIDPNILEWVTPVFDISSNGGDWTLFSQTTQQVTFRNSSGEISPSEVMVFALQVRVKPTAPIGTTPFTMNVRVTPGRSSQAGNANNSPADDNRAASLTIDQALPVKLISFNVTKEVNTVGLKWSTTEEVNSDYFEIQHSMDAKNWSAVKKVESHKDSKALNTYTDTHNNPQKGINYYRLKMVDRDLTFAYSGVKSIDFEGGMRAIIYPNPVSNVIFVRDLGADFKDIKEVSILNQTGQVYYKSNRLSADGIPVQNIPTGNYVLQVRKSSNAIHTFKVAVVR